jgi:hypothetical protein
MTCTDCQEPILESEYRGACWCKRCRGLLHAECRMSSPTEEDFCEYCLRLDAAEFAERMRTRR